MRVYRTYQKIPDSGIIRAPDIREYLIADKECLLSDESPSGERPPDSLLQPAYVPGIQPRSVQLRRREAPSVPYYWKPDRCGNQLHVVGGIMLPNGNPPVRCPEPACCQYHRECRVCPDPRASDRKLYRQTRSFSPGYNLTFISSSPVSLSHAKMPYYIL